MPRMPIESPTASQLRALEARFRAAGFVARIVGAGVLVSLAGRQVSPTDVETVLADWTKPYYLNANFGRVTIIPKVRPLIQSPEAV